jgi:hypothetical protein
VVVFNLKNLKMKQLYQFVHNQKHIDKTLKRIVLLFNQYMLLLIQYKYFRLNSINTWIVLNKPYFNI